MKKLEILKMEMVVGGKNGENTLDCVKDVFSHHGWLGWAAGAMCVLEPAGFFMFSAACAGKNGFS